MKISKEKISFSTYENIVETLITKLIDKKISLVFGFPRGGLPIAVHISHKLKIPMTLLLEDCLNNLKIGNAVLMVDDITDTGITFLSLDKKILNDENCFTASLFYKSHSKFKPDFFVIQTLNWIYMPWEDFNEKPNRKMYENL